MDNKRILIVATKWPSKEHPYLVHLFYRLKKIFPGITLFLFNKGDISWGKAQIGEMEVDDVLRNAKYRSSLNRGLGRVLRSSLVCLVHIKATCYLFKTARKNGYSVKQSLIQCLHYADLLDQRFDLVYFNALQIARHFCIRGVFPKARIIASSRGQDFDLNPSAYDNALASLDHLHVLGSHLEKWALLRNFAKPITKIPPAFPPLDSYPNVKSENNNKIIIATAARLFWTKGYEYSIRVVKELAKKHNVEYWIFGAGPEKEKLLFMSKMFDLNEIVKFQGWIPEKELVEQLSSIHIYMLLSIEEGFNNSVILAQSLGIPCVVSDAGGLPENVIHGETGFVVPRYNVSQAIQAVTQLIEDKASYNKMSQSGRDRVAIQFSLERQAARYAEMFTEVLKPE